MDKIWTVADQLSFCVRQFFGRNSQSVLHRHLLLLYIPAGLFQFCYSVVFLLNSNAFGFDLMCISQTSLTVEKH